MTTPVQFFHRHIGRYLTPGPDPAAGLSVLLPTRCGGKAKEASIKQLRIGALDAYFWAAEAGSGFVSRIDGDSEPAFLSKTPIKMVPSESESGEKYLAQWLLFEAKAPFMVGMIGRASPLKTLKVSPHEKMGTFCRSGGNVTFDLPALRAAYQLFKPFEWFWVNKALEQRERYQMACEEKRKGERDKLIKMFEKMPGLQEAIQASPIKPFSGESVILGWANIQRQSNFSTTAR